MYFTNRMEAGQLLADKLQKYRYENAVVVAMSESSVLVAREIAASLHATLLLMALESIDLPGEGQTYGVMNHAGEMSFNSAMSQGERDDYYGELHGTIDQEQRFAFQTMNRLLSDGGYVSRDLVRHQTVIVVADGLKDETGIEAAGRFFRPVKLDRLVVATPIASVAAVDRMHIIADEIHCLGVSSNFLDVDHYYDENHVPDHKGIVEMVNQNLLYWR